MTIWNITRYRLHAWTVTLTDPNTGRTVELGAFVGDPGSAIAEVLHHMEPGDVVLIVDEGAVTDRFSVLGNTDPESKRTVRLPHTGGGHLN